jgi:hypothetical protein
VTKPSSEAHQSALCRPRRLAGPRFSAQRRSESDWKRSVKTVSAGALQTQYHARGARESNWRVLRVGRLGFGIRKEKAHSILGGMSFFFLLPGIAFASLTFDGRIRSDGIATAKTCL